MAKGTITVEGLSGLLADFNDIVGNIGNDIEEALNESFSEIANNMKSNSMSVFTDGYTQGIMIRSISHHVSLKDGNVNASVGVYDMSNKTGTSARRIPEPVLAYWYEMGIQPHSTAKGARAGASPNGKQTGKKPKGQTGKLHRGSPPRPFLSTAFDTASSGIFPALVKKLNERISK